MERETRRRLLQVSLGALGLALVAGALLWLRPPCPILHWTGFYCGACGTTRMVEALLAGRVGDAFWENPYLFCLLPLAGVYLVWEAVRYVKRKPPLWKRKGTMALLGAAVVLGIVFTVVRNVPGFEMLRP